MTYEDRIKELRKGYKKNRLKRDIGYRNLLRCRRRLNNAVKGKSKSKETTELIGCTIDELLLHLENQFTEGMTWDNYGDWHIDHIISCASFNFELEEEQKQCFHYSNLQPLWAEDNINKGKY